jgi:hypothetical protein
MYVTKMYVDVRMSKEDIENLCLVLQMHLRNEVYTKYSNVNIFSSVENAKSAFLSENKVLIDMWKDFSGLLMQHGDKEKSILGTLEHSYTWVKNNPPQTEVA